MRYTVYPIPITMDGDDWLMDGDDWLRFTTEMYCHSVGSVENGTRLVSVEVVVK